MTEYVGYVVGPAFVALLLISLLALVVFVPSLLKKKSVQKVELYTKLIGVLTAVVSLSVSVMGITVPLRAITEDRAQSALDQYFEALKSKHFQNAYDILHPDRILEKRQETGNPAWGLRDFEALFEGTRGYANRKIEYVRLDGTDRLYRVTYDVFDSVPHSAIFGMRRQLFSSKALDQIFNREEIIKVVVDNLRQYYVVADESIPAIRNHINKKILDDLLDPIFVAAMVGELSSVSKLDLKPNPSRPNNEIVERHFVHNEIRMSPVNGGWKMRRLDTDVIAPYSKQ